MAPYFDRNPNPLDLKRLIIIMRRSYLRISVLTLIVAGITAFYLYTRPPIYRATAVLQVPKIHLQTQVEILRADRITENVITELKLSAVSDAPAHSSSEQRISLTDIGQQLNHWFSTLYNYLSEQLQIISLGTRSDRPQNSQAENSAARHQEYVTEFKSRLNVYSVKDTRLINVSYAHHQPEMAAIIANTYAIEYIKLSQKFQRQQQLNSSLYQDDSVWLDEGASRLSNKISQAERELSDFLQQDHLTENDEATSKELQRLTHKLQTSTELYELVKQQQEEQTGKSENVQQSAILTEQAKPPLSADNLKRLAIFIAIILLTIILLLLQAFLRSLYLVDRENITRLKAPLLGTLPDIKAAEKNFNHLSPQEIFSSNRLINDAAQSLGIALQLKGSDQKKQVIVITSASAGEGKSTSAIYLAMSLASNKKVILIEADMRKPSVGRRLGIPQSHNGLASLLLSGGRLADCIWQDKETGLDIMPAGDIPQSPLNLLTSERFKSCLTILKSHYDHIIIDSPPSQPVSDTLVIGQLSDFNIVITRSNYSKKQELAETITMLSKHNINVDGIILNRIALQDDKHYQYQYRKKAS